MKLVHKPFARTTISRAIAVVIATLAVALNAHAGNANCAHDTCVDGRIVNRHADETAPYAVTEPSPGTYRFEIRPGDRWSVDRGSPRERAELSFDEEPVEFGSTYRVSYDMLIEGTAPCSPRWCVTGQWHATEDAGDASSSPPLGMSLDGRDLVVYTQSAAARYHGKNPTAVERARVRNIARNTWIQVRYDVRFEPSGGWLDVSIAGTRRFTGKIPLGYNDAVGPYFKFGIYRYSGPAKFVVRYRNLSIRRQAP